MLTPSLCRHVRKQHAILHLCDLSTPANKPCCEAYSLALTSQRGMSHRKISVMICHGAAALLVSSETVVKDAYDVRRTGVRDQTEQNCEVLCHIASISSRLNMYSNILNSLTDQGVANALT